MDARCTPIRYIDNSRIAYINIVEYVCVFVCFAATKLTAESTESKNSIEGQKYRVSVT